MHAFLSVSSVQRTGDKQRGAKRRDSFNASLDRSQATTTPLLVRYLPPCSDFLEELSDMRQDQARRSVILVPGDRRIKRYDG